MRGESNDPEGAVRQEERNCSKGAAAVAPRTMLAVPATLLVAGEQEEIVDDTAKEEGEWFSEEVGSVYVGSTAATHWYTDIDPESGFQYWYGFDAESMEPTTSQWTFPEELQQQAEVDAQNQHAHAGATHSQSQGRDSDTPVSGSWACALCHSRSSYMFHRDASVYACCNICGWVEECAVPGAASGGYSAPIDATKSPQPGAGASASIRAARMQLASSMQAARRSLEARVKVASSKLSHTAARAILRGKAIARGAPPAYFAAKVAALSRLQNAKKWSLRKLETMKAAAAEKYPAYFADEKAPVRRDATGARRSSGPKRNLDTSHLRQFQALLVAGFDAMHIEARSFEQSVHLLRPGDSLYYECAVLKLNITLDVIRRDMQPGGAIETPAAPSTVVESGTFCSKHLRLPPSSATAASKDAVQIIIRFNNSSSWFRSKDVAFRIVVGSARNNRDQISTTQRCFADRNSGRAHGQPGAFNSSQDDDCGIPVVSMDSFLHARADE
eukprot:INCI15092.1.p1 GENE.INCI15092.1~~INCI15092.1.p1  ORF type:complete len:501 (-),score=83.79 INCI15092.1:116-1618(-)